MTEDERMQIAALGPASAGAVFDAVQPTFFKLVLPVGALAFLAAAASLATCYGSILATAFLGVPAERVMNPHLQAAMMWGFALLAVYRSEEHTSELQSLMRISYAVFCLKK